MVRLRVAKNAPDLKAASFDFAQVRGFNPIDDNEADALALLDWALSQGGVQ